MIALTQPIAGVDDRHEQKVLAILAQLSRTLPAWRAGKDLQAEIASRSAERTPLLSRQSKLREESRDVEAQIAGLARRRDMLISFGLGLASLLLAGAILWACLTSTVEKRALALVLLLVYPPVWARRKFRREKERLVELRTRSEREQAQVADEIGRINERLATISRELADRPVSFPEIRLAEICFPVLQRKILGYDCLLDGSGVFPVAKLSTIDLSDVGDGLEPIAEAVSQLVNVPVLLAPASSFTGDEPLERLYGEEDEFQKLVAAFTGILGRVRDISLPLPLIPGRSPVAAAIPKGKPLEQGHGNVIEIVGADVGPGSVEEFVARVNDVSIHGQRTLASLNRTFEALSSIGRLYARARSGSINHLHQQLFDVLDRASWCTKRFYCPRSIQSPSFVYDTLGICFEEAHAMPLADLLTKMRGDPVIAARLAERPDLVEQLRVAALSVEEFGPEMARDPQGNPLPPEPRAIYIEDQYAEALKQFRLALTAALFGSTNPTLCFSEESRVHYDPTVEEWRSAVSPHAYSTGQVQRYGQILKVQNDLLFPMWEQLWQEKADFRKSELFRTNESLIRMSEKESEKLIEIGNQFRADMRTIREHVYLLEPELIAQIGEVRRFKDGMGALGLLSETHRAMLADDKLGNLTIPEGSLLAEGHAHETLLGLEPKNQTARRGTVHDPIDDARAPGILIAHTVQRTPRLVLTAGVS